MSRILFTGYGQIPGISGPDFTVESSITWGPWEVNRAYVFGTFLDDATVDTGNIGNTSRLRPGLALTFNNTTRKASNFTSGNPFYGFLLWDNLSGVDTTGNAKTAGKWFGYALVAGQVKDSQVFYDTGTPANNNPGNLRGGAALLAEVNKYFILDDFYLDRANITIT